MTREATIAAVRSVLTQTEGVRLALLFGSVARDTPNEDSDVDIALDAGAMADWLGIAAKLSHVLGKEIHLVALRDPGVPLLEELVRDGIVVYEATPHAAARWRAHALLELETDGPWYARMRDAWLKRVASRGLGDGES